MTRFQLPHTTSVRASPPARQRGFTLAEMLMVLGAVGLLIVITTMMYTDVDEGIDETQAVLELNTLIGGIQTYRQSFAAQGSFAGLTWTTYKAGYPTAGIDDRGFNAYNEAESSIAIAVTTVAGAAGTRGPNSAKLTYPTSSADACTSLLANFTNGTNYAPGIIAGAGADTTQCSTANLVLIID